MESAFEVGNSRLPAYNVREKGTVSHEQSSDHFQKSIPNGFFMKRKLHYISLSGYFLKFLVHLFQNNLMHRSLTEFSRVLGCRL